MSNEKVKQSRDTAIKNQFTKQFGINVRTFSDNEPAPTYRPLPTGIAEIDTASGIGGMPGGTIIEAFGPSQSGKSYYCCVMSAEIIKNGGRVLYIDLEGLDFNRLQDLGVVLDGGHFHYVSDFENGEQVLEAAKFALSLKEDENNPLSKCFYDLVVIDSIYMVRPKVEEEKNLEDAVVATQARLFSKAMPQLLSRVRKNDNILILINQVRNKIGVMYGSPETTPGGEAIRFVCHIRIRFEQMTGKDWKIRSSDSNGERIIGGHSKFEFIKSRVGVPNISGYFPIYFVPNDQLDQFELMFAKACNAKLLRLWGGQYLFPWATSPKQATFATKDFDEFKDYLIEYDYLPKILEKLGYSNVDAEAQKIIENVQKMREQKANAPRLDNVDEDEGEDDEDVVPITTSDDDE